MKLVLNICFIGLNIVKILFQHIINIKFSNEIFCILFSSKFLKAGMYVTVKAYLN
jgi:hypothetical protein